MRVPFSNRWNFLVVFFSRKKPGRRADAARSLEPRLAGQAFLAVLFSSFCLAGQPPPVCGSNEVARLHEALVEMNMTEADLGFTKDVAEPRQALQWIRDTLHDPMRLPARADEIIAGASTDVWAMG